MKTRSELENLVRHINQLRGENTKYFYKLSGRNGNLYIDEIRRSNDLPDRDACFAGTKAQVYCFLSGMLEILQGS